MKEPKTFTRPRMYYQEGILNSTAGTMHSNNGRIRIIYPDGTCEYAMDYIFEENIQMNPNPADPTDYFFTKIFKSPCWAKSGLTAQEQLERMRDYDGYYKQKSVYLGEI